MKKIPDNLIALDLLRFACALLVVVYHFGWGYPMHPPPGGGALLTGMAVDSRLAHWTNSGWVGVELFFVISGFVIAWSAEGSRPMPFLGRRALRLLPAVWLCASLTAVALLAISDLPSAAVTVQWLASVLFWPLIRPIDPSYWTLAIEVSFYLLVAVVLVGGSTLARIERLAVALAGASCAYWIAEGYGAVPPAYDRLTQLALLPHGCFFALGILLRAHRRLGSSALGFLGFVLAGAAILMEIRAHGMEICGDELAYVPPLLLFAAGLLPILFADRVQPFLSRSCQPGAARAIGLMTYPLYLLHQELGAMVIGALLHAGMLYWFAALVALVLLLALAWLVTRIGEPPLRAMLKRLAPSRTGGAMPLGQIAV